MKDIQTISWSGPSQPEERIERHSFAITKTVEVIGQLAVVRLEKGDTLPDIARHFGLGISEISAANPGVDMWVPAAGTHLVLPLCFVLPEAPKKGVVINLASMRLFHYSGDGKSLTVSTYPIGIGSTQRPTPMGQMTVERKTTLPTWHVPDSIAEDHRRKGDPLPSKVLPGPDNPLGEYALYLDAPTYLIHGTNKPASIGLRATNGCIRLYPENIERLYQRTPVQTPVRIVDQPYLIGQHDGAVYLEIHPRLEDSEADGIKKIYAQLRQIEKQSARKLDWKKIENTVTEARGLPMAISVAPQSSVKTLDQALRIKHPASLFGRPKTPEIKTQAWYVLAADLHDETSAERLCAMINHQGPPIPARVLPKADGFRVIAGPFADAGAAKSAAKRLKIDLEIDGVLIEPNRKK